MECFSDSFFNLYEFDSFDGVGFYGFAVMGAARASIVVVPAIVAVERIAGGYWGQAIATNEEALERGAGGGGLGNGFEKGLDLLKY